jgi:hypothetical protein
MITASATAAQKFPNSMLASPTRDRAICREFHLSRQVVRKVI